MNNKNNNNLKMWILFIIILILLGGLTSGGFALVVFWKNDTIIRQNNNVSNKNIYNYKFQAPQYILNDANITNNWGPKIYEANLNPDDNMHPTYWLGKKGLKKFVSRIQQELGYGPEIFLLKDVIIGNENMISVENNGSYFPSTNQILINTKNFRNILNEKELMQNGKTEEEILDAKVEMIFQTFYHEYGHHVGYVYLQSIKEYDLNATNNIWTWNNDQSKRIKSYWNRSFITEFKKALNYNIKELPLLHHINEKIWKRKSKTSFEITPFYSVGKYFTSQDLFEGSNSQQIRKFNLQNKKAIFSGPELILDFSNKNKDKDIYKTNKNISYMFSMSELFTRKYMIKNYVFNLNNRWNKKNSIISPRGFINVGNKILFSSFINDVAKYKNIWTPNGPIIGPMDIDPILIYGDKYLSDDPFNQNATNMYELLRKYMGQYDGSDISLIFSKNSIQFKHNSESTNANVLKNINQNDEYKQIKIAGYIKQIEDYVSIGYWKNGQFQNLSDIQIKNYMVRSKQELDSTTYDVLPIGEKKFYITKKFIDATQILNKQLFFQRQDGAWIPMTSVRSGNFGNASNWLSNYEYHNNKKEYRAIKDGDKIVIKEYLW